MIVGLKHVDIMRSIIPIENKEEYIKNQGTYNMLTKQ